MAKKRKAYNPMKQLTRVADHLTRGVLIGYTTGLGGCIMINIKGCRIIPPESREGRQVVAALGRPHTWSCTIGVFGRTQLGEQYMKSEVITTSSRYYQADLAPTFEEYHAKLIPSIPEHHRVAVGWLASPSGVELSEKQASEIFESMGAWDDGPTVEEEIARLINLPPIPTEERI